MPCYDSADALDFALTDLASLPRFDALWMADPRDFEVAYAINPHMRDEGGALHTVDRAHAREQWSALREACERLGCSVEVIAPLEEHPDLVFCANPGLPIPAAISGGAPRWVPSRMASAERAGEVAHLSAFAAARGYTIEPLEGGAERFEGTGDGLWHPGRQLLWGGVGPRTSAAAWEELATRYSLPIVRLELCDPDFYHLDTCLALLSEDCCLWYPPAFDERGRELIRRLIARTIEVDEEEARLAFACNAMAVEVAAAGADGPAVILQRGSPKTCHALLGAGFRVVEVETEEFVKSGGSVFCMKLAAPRT